MKIGGRMIEEIVCYPSIYGMCDLFDDDNDDGNVSDFEGFYNDVTASDEIAPSTDGVESQ